MFNNPFDSFHNTVAEAKEEREQLDQLLTVSTPRERLLVAIVALIVALLAAWLFLGHVSHSRAVDAVVVEPVNGDRLQLLVWAGHDGRSPAGPGLSATVELLAADGNAPVLKGKIASVSAVHTVRDLAMPVSMYLVDVTIDRDPDMTIPAGIRCRIVIDLPSQSPFSLLGMRPS